MNVLFFGNIGVLARRGQPGPSTIVRCLNVCTELRKANVNGKVVYNYINRLGANINAVRQSDIVVFHRIQTPFNKIPQPPLEPVLMLESKASGKPCGFDFDDSIFLTHPLVTEFLIAKSNFVMAGSHFLFDYAKRWNKTVYLVPSAVDTQLFRPRVRRRSPSGIVLGWHGSARVQFEYLKLLKPILSRLARKYDITFQLLGSLGAPKIQKYFSSIPGLRTEFGPDSWIPYETLPHLLANVDIGISPMPTSTWAAGKCGMKALEYMAMEIPVVASAVGEHNYIIQDGTTGLLARDNSEWEEKLAWLIEDTRFRQEIARKGRMLVEKRYALKAVTKTVKSILELFNDST